MPSVEQLPSGRWRVQWRGATGRRYGAGFSFPTKSAARQYGLDREAEVRRGEGRDPRAGRVTLGEWVERWVQARVAEPRTLSKERSLLGRHVLPAMGDTALDRIDRLTVQAWVSRLSKSGLAAGTVRGAHRVLHQVLTAAVDSELLRSNPAERIKLPATPPPSDFHWTREQIDAAAAQLDGQDRVVLDVLVGTGLRWGELAGLHADRIDLLRRRLTVAEVLEEDVGGMRLKAYPKSRRRRDVPLAPDLRELLAAHLAVRPSLKPCGLQHPARTRCSGLVFYTAAGNPLSRHVWPRKVLHPAMAAAGVPRGRVHDLRHTYASWLVADGVPLRVVQQLLGHADGRTSERYAHLQPDAIDDPSIIAALRRGDVGRAAQQSG
jgi:integrase